MPYILSLKHTTNNPKSKQNKQLSFSQRSAKKRAASATTTSCPGHTSQVLPASRGLRGLPFGRASTPCPVASGHALRGIDIYKSDMISQFLLFFQYIFIFVLFLSEEQKFCLFSIFSSFSPSRKCRWKMTEYGTNSICIIIMMNISFLLYNRQTYIFYINVKKLWKKFQPVISFFVIG